jgi:hypothetical protein
MYGAARATGCRVLVAPWHRPGERPCGFLSFLRVVRDDLKRLSSRQTRLDGQHKGLEPPTTPQLSGTSTPTLP